MMASWQTSTRLPFTRPSTLSSGALRPNGVVECRSDRRDRIGDRSVGAAGTPRPRKRGGFHRREVSPNAGWMIHPPCSRRRNEVFILAPTGEARMSGHHADSARPGPRKPGEHWPRLGPRPPEEGARASPKRGVARTPAGRRPPPTPASHSRPQTPAPRRAHEAPLSALALSGRARYWCAFCAPLDRSAVPAPLSGSPPRRRRRCLCVRCSAKLR